MTMAGSARHFSQWASKSSRLFGVAPDEGGHVDGFGVALLVEEDREIGVDHVAPRDGGHESLIQDADELGDYSVAAVVAGV